MGSLGKERRTDSCRVPNGNGQDGGPVVVPRGIRRDWNLYDHVAALEAGVGELSGHYRIGPSKCACGYDAHKVGAFFPDYFQMLRDHIRASSGAPR